MEKRRPSKSMFLLIIGSLALAAFLSLVLLALGVFVRLLALERRVQALERQLSERSRTPLPQSESLTLAGLRVAIMVRQDHPSSPFETILAEVLANEGALRVEDQEDVRIAGTIKGNGYADVYFDADLTVEAQGQVVLKMREGPPHGDRPENLAREIVARLRSEMEKRERQNALRELG